jgi:hypothetical protein
MKDSIQPQSLLKYFHNARIIPGKENLILDKNPTDGTEAVR